VSLPLTREWPVPELAPKVAHGAEAEALDLVEES
jgi:hypothetical protein